MFMMNILSLYQNVLLSRISIHGRMFMMNILLLLLLPKEI